ncbi:MAG: hypothetical protein ACMUIG_09320 [Thermoplasmatota archaeon]
MNKVKYHSEWSEISKITTSRDKNIPTSSLGIETKDGSIEKVSTSVISGRKLKEGFPLIRMYCQRNWIKIENDDNW